MNSPITGNPMKLVKEPAKLNFRKEDFEVIYHYYLCTESNEQYTTDELDLINQNQVHNMYREKYGIPFPDEIKQIRELYGVSASKMSEILGFGANSYRLYETGEIPSVANGRLILAVKHPKDFVKQIEASEHLLGDKDSENLLDKVKHVYHVWKKTRWDELFTKQIFEEDSPSEFSGYRKGQLEKIANLISFFGSNMELYKTKLNKLLFYSDFGHYQRTGYSITGITYRAIQMGPVPANYDKLYVKLMDDKKITIINEPYTGGNYTEKFKGNESFDENLFEPKELEIINLVFEKFKNMTSKEVVDLSHEEEAWVANEKNRELISYQQYGFELKHV